MNTTGVVAIVVIVLVATAGTAFLVTQPNRTSSSQSGSSPPSDTSGGRSIQVYEITYLGGGYTVYVNASYLGSGSWSVSPANFRLVSNTSQVYPATVYPCNDCGQLKNITLLNGDRDIGTVGFSLPYREVPLKLEYLANDAQLTVANLPAPTDLNPGRLAQVSVTTSALRASDFLSTGTTTTFNCKSSSTGSYLILTNTGTGAATVTGVSIQWAGANNVFAVKASPTINPCVVSAAGGANSNLYLFFGTTSTLTVSAVAGRSYTGTVTFSNGEIATFTGSFA